MNQITNTILMIRPINFRMNEQTTINNYFQENKAKAANPEVAEEYGYFWVVGEAKDREGSAVVLGSNFVTPTLEVTDSVLSQESARKQSQDTMQNLYDFYKQLIY